MRSENPTPARLEAFSDGVIAVIITIMVLELKIPAGNGLAGLYSILPTLLVYLLSFTFTGIYWINHHQLVDRVRRIDGLTLYANLIFLFCLSLLPFFTNYMLVKGEDSFSVALYAVSLIATALGFFLLRLAIGRILLGTGEFIREDAFARRKHLLSLIINTLAVPLAYWHPAVALGALTSVILLWIVPNFGLKPTLASKYTESPS